MQEFIDFDEISNFSHAEVESFLQDCDTASGNVRKAEAEYPTSDISCAEPMPHPDVKRRKAEAEYLTSDIPCAEPTTHPDVKHQNLSVHNVSSQAIIVQPILYNPRKAHQSNRDAQNYKCGYCGTVKMSASMGTVSSCTPPPPLGMRGGVSSGGFAGLQGEDQVQLWRTISRREKKNAYKMDTVAIAERDGRRTSTYHCRCFRCFRCFDVQMIDTLSGNTTASAAGYTSDDYPNKSCPTVGVDKRFDTGWYTNHNSYHIFPLSLQSSKW